jgi:EAL domain-containing protein (putative c-di-GMP-specific phosphodiesterase class I)
MRADVANLDAIHRGLELPASRRMTVLIGSSDPRLLHAAEHVAAQRAQAIDLRATVARIVVDDALDFLRRVVDRIDPARRHEVRLAFADPDLETDRLVERALMGRDLADYANRLERAEFQHRPPHYAVRFQPIVGLSSRTVIGYESLLRAEVDEIVVDAEDLIARANRGDWIGELDRLGRTLAIRSVGPWLGQGLLFLNVLAPGGSFDEDAVNATIDAAIEIGLAPDQIVLEAVERNRYRDLTHAADQIDRFRRRGVRIAVDDVGDGYAGLRVLSAFSPDIVKITGHLVAELAPTAAHRQAVPDEASMARSIIATVVELAHRSGAWVVAESIETDEQLERLGHLGVDWGQGLLLGAPAHRQPSRSLGP